MYKKKSKMVQGSCLHSKVPALHFSIGYRQVVVVQMNKITNIPKLAQFYLWNKNNVEGLRFVQCDDGWSCVEDWRMI